MAGKGSKRRPSSVSSQQIADNWELAFGKKPDNIEVKHDIMIDHSNIIQEDGKSLDNNN